MNHRALLASLTRGQRRLLTERSDLPGLWHLAGHWGVILALGFCIALALPGWQLLLVPQGILIVFLFTALHETIHRTAFKRRWLNALVAHVCGFLLVLPPEWFRHFHNDHHRFTQDPERDPELATPKPTTLSAFLWTLSGLPVWRSHLTTLLRNAAGRCRDSYVPEAAQPRVRREARLLLATYVLLFALSLVLASDLLLWVWVVPAILGQPFLRAYLLAEHGGCAFVPDMLANSRTTFTNRAVRWLAWNMPYHAEHHAYPAVPFHKLPAFHALTREHLKVTSPGYATFLHDEVAALAK